MTRLTSDVLAIEAGVLGAVIGNETLYARAAFLEEDAFSDDAHAIVWSMLQKMKLGGQRVTVATLAVHGSDTLDSIGGMSFLNRLSSMGATILPAFDQAVDRLHEEMQWRRIANIASRLQHATTLREKRPEEILSALIRIAGKNLSSGHAGFVSKHQAARSAIAAAQAPRETLTTGINSLDYLMQGGIQTRRLYGIGGPTGRGKTILLSSISDNVNIQGAPHLFITLETPPEDIEVRNCAKHLNINASTILDVGDPDHQTFVKHTEAYLARLPDNTVYDFAPGATIDEIHRKILAAKNRYKIKGFIIDYWQLIRGRDRGQTEESHLRDVADRLAAICRQEDLWGIITAQVDERGRLKVSEALVQSASLYVRLVRDENERAAYFMTEKSNYTRYADTGSESIPGMIFDDQVGPHFRNTDAIDAGDLQEEGNISL